MINQYDSLSIVKISDFGLVKVPDSALTSINTEFKGSLNDPSLDIYGFSNYNISHETYALTRVIYFVMTGKTTINKFTNKSLENFILTGTNKIESKRFKNISELKKAFFSIKF